MTFAWIWNYGRLLRPLSWPTTLVQSTERRRRRVSWLRQSLVLWWESHSHIYPEEFAHVRIRVHAYCDVHAGLRLVCLHTSLHILASIVISFSYMSADVKLDTSISIHAYVSERQSSNCARAYVHVCMHAHICHVMCIHASSCSQTKDDVCFCVCTITFTSHLQYCALMPVFMCMYRYVRWMHTHADAHAYCNLAFKDSTIMTRLLALTGQAYKVPRSVCYRDVIFRGDTLLQTVTRLTLLLTPQPVIVESLGLSLFELCLQGNCCAESVSGKTISRHVVHDTYMHASLQLC